MSEIVQSVQLTYASLVGKNPEDHYDLPHLEVHRHSHNRFIVYYRHWSDSLRRVANHDLPASIDPATGDFCLKFWPEWTFNLSPDGRLTWRRADEDAV